MPPNRRCICRKAWFPTGISSGNTQEEQREIYLRRKAMECPLCRAGVHYDLFELAAASPAAAIAKRDINKAALWAKYNHGTNLGDYLKTEVGRPYANQWTDLEVEEADNAIK